MANIQLRDVVEDGTPVSKALFRNAIISRYPYAIADGENPSDLVVNDAGVVPYYLVYGGKLFWLDAGDTSSGPPDNVTLIVTADGYRYFSDGEYSQAWSVLSQGDNTPPMAPTIGDTYQTGLSPTGDWAGYPNSIAVYTRRGWLFQTIPVGKLIYVVDEDSYYHRDANGDFTLGTGTAQLGAGTVRDTMLVGGQRFYTVENQTTATPTGSLTLGIYWIVGSGATGSWAGQDGLIATSYDGTNWTFIQPIEGWHAYDKTLNSLYKFNGTSWQNASGAWLNYSGYALPMGTTTSISFAGTSYTPSVTTAPVITNNHGVLATLNFATNKTGNGRLRVTGQFSFSGTGASYTVAVLRDSETAAISWAKILDSSNTLANELMTVSFLISVADLANHAYRLALFRQNAVTIALTVSNVVFTIEEVA